MARTVLGLALVAAAWLACAQSAEVLLLPPLQPRRAGVETLLVTAPGAYVPGIEYLRLSQQIQQEALLPLWVAVLTNFTSDFPTSAELSRAIQSAVTLAQQQGFTTIQDNDVWCIGHSLGALYCADLVRSKYGGQIMMGSYLSEQPTEPLRQFPKPILHLGGELDGLTETSRQAEDYRVPRDLLVAGDVVSAVYQKPVVMVKGLNHANMGNGYVTSRLAQEDYPAEISVEASTALLASATAAFLTLHRGGAGVSDAFALLLSELQTTDAYLNGFLEAQDADAAGTWCPDGQRAVANLVPEAAARVDVVVVNYDNVDAFAESKPTIVGTGSDRYLITTTAYLERTVLKTEGRSGYELDCKFKSQEAIANTMRLAPGQYGTAGTCATVNQLTLDRVLQSLPSSMTTRYQSIGKPMVFVPDVVYDQGNLWLPSHVNYTETAVDFQVQSTSLVSADGIPVVGGMCYCKGLPAATAAKWVMNKSLPRGLP